ncbi:MAG: recombinase family protein [Dermatophilaceae bacterium]
MLVSETGIQPLMYGYLRAPEEMPDDDLDRAVHHLQRYAETEGYCYATTFLEYEPGSQDAFAELIAELKRAEARHVVVPSLEHLSSHRLIRASMVDRLELDASASVLTPDGT